MRLLTFTFKFQHSPWQYQISNFTWSAINSDCQHASPWCSLVRLRATETHGKKGENKTLWKERVIEMGKVRRRTQRKGEEGGGGDRDKWLWCSCSLLPTSTFPLLSSPFSQEEHCFSIEQLAFSALCAPSALSGRKPLEIGKSYIRFMSNAPILLFYDDCLSRFNYEEKPVLGTYFKNRKLKTVTFLSLSLHIDTINLIYNY